MLIYSGDYIENMSVSEYIPLIIFRFLFFHALPLANSVKLGSLSKSLISQIFQ